MKSPLRMVTTPGGRLLVDTGSESVRKTYMALVAKRHDQLCEMLRRNNIDHAPIICGRDYVKGLITFFKTRERRQAYV